MIFFETSMRKKFPTRVLLLLLLLSLSSCASTGQTTDPLEPFNRKVQTFNDTVDTYAIKPVAQGYAYVVPEFIRIGLPMLTLHIFLLSFCRYD